MYIKHRMIKRFLKKGAEMGRKPGIQDVARAAGVSVGTVSKVLNPASSANIRISEATREKVLTLAGKLNYTANYGATLLRGCRTGTIGFIANLPDEFNSPVISSYQMRILNGLSAAAQEKGYQILLISGGDYSSFLEIKRIDALVLINFRLRDNRELAEMIGMYRTFNERRYPYVVINNTCTELPVPSVSVDNLRGMELTAEHILAKGYGSVGFAGEITDNLQQHHLERFAALQNCLKNTPVIFPKKFCILGPNCGIPPIPRTGAFNHRDGQEAMRHLAQSGNLPRCLVCGNDDIAQGVICMAAQLGIRIPEELAVIGFDDQMDCAYWNPPLTTVHQPLEEMGCAACGYLLKKIEKPETFRQITIKPTFMERMSG